MTAEASARQDIDVLSHHIWGDGVPHAALDELRRTVPVYRHQIPSDLNEHTAAGSTRDWMWFLTAHADVREVNRDAERFSSEAMGVQLWDDPGSESAPTMLGLDAPEHTRLRRLVSRGFTPRMISRFTDRYRQVAAAVIEDAKAKADIDFVTDVAVELPLIAIAELLGVPLNDRQRIFDWTNTLTGSSDPEYSATAEDAFNSAMQLYQYATDLADHRRAEPQDDIITKLITEVDGDALGAHEFELFILLLAVAGSETSRNAITHGILAFDQHPDQWEALAAAHSPGRSHDPVPLDLAVDEILRWSTPVNMFRRTATVDTTVGGVNIAEGDGVIVCYAAANRDPAVFNDPHQFDSTRSPNDHVSFGGGGPHHCLGANLARLELSILFDELLRQNVQVELTGPPVRLRSNLFNGIKHLPARLS